MLKDSISAAVNDSGLKQKYIAEQMGLSEPTFSAIMTGRRKIDVDEFFKLANILHKTPSELYNYAA